MASPGKANKWPKIASQLKTVAERELTERESRKGTYTEEMPRSSQLPPEKARELSDFLFEYRKGWTVQRGKEIVANNLIVKEFYEFLVPDHVSEKDFWERYRWRCDADRIRKELEALPQDDFEKMAKQASKQQQEEEPSRVWALPDKKKAHIPQVVMPPPQTTNSVYDRSLLLHKKVTSSASPPPRPLASEVTPETKPIYDRSSLLKTTSPAKTPIKASEGMVDSKPVYDRSILRKSSRMIVQDVQDIEDSAALTTLSPVDSSQLEKITHEVNSNQKLPVKPVYDRSSLRTSSRKIVQDMQDIEDSTVLTTFSQVDASQLESILHEEKSNQPLTEKPVYDRSILRKSSRMIVQDVQDIEDSAALTTLSPVDSSQLEKITHEVNSNQQLPVKPVYDRSILRTSSRMIVQDKQGIEDSTVLTTFSQADASQLESILHEEKSNQPLTEKPVYDRSILRKSSRKIVQDMQDIEDSAALTTLSQVDASQLESILHEEKTNQPLKEKPVYDRSILRKSSRKIVQDMKDKVEDSAGLTILSPVDSSQHEKIMHEGKSNQQLTGKDPVLDCHGDTANLSQQDLGEVESTHYLTSSPARITTNDAIENFPTMKPASIETERLFNESEDIPSPPTTTRITTNDVIEKSPTMKPKSIETEQRPSECEDTSTCESPISVPTLEPRASLPPMRTENVDVAALPDSTHDGLELQLNATPSSVPDQEKSLARTHESFLCP